MARQANGIGRKRLGKFGERAHNRRLVTAGKIGTTVTAREKRVAHKGDVPLLGRGEQDDAARRMPRRLDHLQTDVAHLDCIALGKQARRLTGSGVSIPHMARCSSIFARGTVTSLAHNSYSALSPTTALEPGDPANMVGMTVRADRAEYAHLGMRGADMLHKTLALHAGSTIKHSSFEITA